MKYPHSSLVTLTFGAIAALGLSTASAQTAATRPPEKPIVLTPPAVNDGSSWSRAPMPAQRKFDDVKGPDGKAIDDLPPNTAETNTEPVIPPPRVAIFQPTPAPAPVIGAEPNLLPTGRPTIAVSSGIDAASVTQSIRASTMANRDQILSDIESRVSASERMMSTAHITASDDVKAKARALKKSVAAARKDWTGSREKLAADYEAYAAALTRVDAANGISR